MRVWLCLTMMVSTAFLFEQQVAQAGDQVIHDPAPVAAVSTAPVAGCSHCQGQVGLRTAYGPAPTVNNGCRVDVCAQAAQAGLNLGCCDPDVRPYMSLWADYCSEKKQGFGFLGGGACGCAAGCQTRSWGRGCSGCGVGGCGLGTLGHKLGHLHPRVLGSTVVSSDCGCAASGADSTSAEATEANAAEPATDNPSPDSPGPSPDGTPAVTPPPAPADAAAPPVTPTPPAPAESNNSAWRFRRLPQTPDEVAPAGSETIQPPTASLNSSPRPSVWDRLRGKF
ncbi:MAG: hypothetical protein U0795_16115 [Pirellulales bacterium]